MVSLVKNKILFFLQSGITPYFSHDVFLLKRDVVQSFLLYDLAMNTSDTKQLDSMLSYVSNRDGNRPPSFFDKGIVRSG